MHDDAFAERCFLTHTERLLHAKPCIQGCIFAQELCKHTHTHRDATLNRDAFTKTSKECVCKRSFDDMYFTQFPTADQHFAQKNSESRCKTAISPIETQFLLKGCKSANKIVILLFFFTIETHFVGEDLCKAIQMQTTVLSPQF